jgi:DNA adenine methylase
MRLPHPLPYQGSKRNLADEILRYFPKNIDRLIEPFAGSAAITIASAYYFKANKFIINDINEPLINLIKTIIYNPTQIIKDYYDIWNGQLGNEEEYYYKIRNRFNDFKKPEDLLFLLAKCVKAAVRYNNQGDFNQSPDKRRLGRSPQAMREDILGVSQLLKDKSELYSYDYKTILELATINDLIYMDPPYQGTGINGGFNYVRNVDFDDFIISLFELNKKKLSYILSFDGRTGNKTYGNPLPDSLGLTKLEISAGRSSQATLLNRKEYTFEVIYLSPALLQKINLLEINHSSPKQGELFAIYD